jgi:uncharacterized protein YhbP (UPF0306 family)
MNIETTIRTYIQQVLHMSLATSSNNRPWVSEVHFVYDDALNLYFRSMPARRHSLEIADNPCVAGDIITQHHRGQKVRGVYFEGTATKLEGIDKDHIAYVRYCERLGTGPEILEEASTHTGHAFYQVSVSDFYLFDSYENSPGQRFHLSWPSTESARSTRGLKVG